MDVSLDKSSRKHLEHDTWTPQLTLCERRNKSHLLEDGNHDPKISPFKNADPMIILREGYSFVHVNDRRPSSTVWVNRIFGGTAFLEKRGTT